MQPALVGVRARRCRLGATGRVARLSERLRIPVGELVDYGSREQTRTDHLREVARYLGWRLAGEFQWRELDEFLFARAMEHDPPKLLFRLGCEYLASSRVIRPGVVTVLMRVAAAREKSRAETWQRVAHLVEPTRAAELDRLLVVDPLDQVATGAHPATRDRSRPRVGWLVV